MVKPKMFSKSTKEIIQKVFIIKNLKTDEVFSCDLTPKHFFVREAAEYTKQYMQLDNYEVLETEYSVTGDEYV